MPRTWLISYGFADAQGNVARMRVALPFSGNSFTAVASYAASLVAKLNAISDAVITDYTINATYQNEQAQLAEVSSDVTRTGVFVVSLENDNYTLILVPSLRLGLLNIPPRLCAGLVVDDGLPSVAAFKTAITACSDEYGNQVTAYIIGGLAQ